VCPVQCSSGVDQQPFGVPGGGLREVGELPGDPLDAVLDLLSPQLGAEPQLRGDAVRPATGGSGPVAQCRADRSAGGVDPFPVVPIRRTALASRPESVGYDTFAGITVVSARTRLVRNNFASTALASSASFSPSTAVLPHRVVSFINVVGCGTAPSNGIRQNRRQVNESATSRHSDSYPNRYRNFRNIN